MGHAAAGGDRREATLVELAMIQWGVFTRAQALAIGFTSRMIQRRVAAGHWVRLHAGVYRVAGNPVTWHQRLMAACLAAGPGAAASHRSAAALWGIDGYPPGPVEVTVAGSTRMVAGAVQHRARRLTSADTAEVSGIPVTTVARTIIDLATVAGDEELEAAVDWALRERHVSVDYLRRRLAAVGPAGRRGCGRFQGLLADREQNGHFESTREAKFAAMLVAAGLPPPVRQYELRDDGIFVARFDLARPEARVAVEFQSYRHHFGRQAWRRDVSRFNAAVALGWLVFCATEDDARDSDRTLCIRVVSAYRQRMTVR